MTKRYYWLKLDEKFFEDDTIEWIEEQENGKDYVIFYLKLCLKSLKDEGKLIRYVGERLIPYDVKALAKLTNTSPDTVAVAMRLFLEIGLVSNLESGEIYLNQINEMIGTETDVAKRVRKHRAKQEALGHKPDLLQSNKSSLQSNTSVTKCNTEIEKEIEIELEEERDIDNNMSTAEKEYISVLENIENYPLDIDKDLDYMKQLEEKYPTLDIVEAVKKFSIYIMDKPFKKNSNHRSQLNNSFSKYVEWETCLKKDKPNSGKKYKDDNPFLNRG